jgi:hypothetical protein
MLSKKQVAMLRKAQSKGQSQSAVRSLGASGGESRKGLLPSETMGREIERRTGKGGLGNPKTSSRGR